MLRGGASRVLCAWRGAECENGWERTDVREAFIWIRHGMKQRTDFPDAGHLHDGIVARCQLLCTAGLSKNKLAHNFGAKVKDPALQRISQQSREEVALAGNLISAPPASWPPLRTAEHNWPKIRTLSLTRLPAFSDHFPVHVSPLLNSSFRKKDSCQLFSVYIWLNLFLSRHSHKQWLDAHMYSEPGQEPSLEPECFSRSADVTSL